MESPPYEKLLRTVLNSLPVDGETQQYVEYILSTQQIQLSKERQIELLAEIVSITRYLENRAKSQKKPIPQSSESLPRIQNVVRRYLMRRRLSQTIQYHKPRISILRDMIQKENEYNKFLSILTQHSIPLLDTTDAKLKDESKDIREILYALVDIEKLHRKLSRKFRWFVEEGCDWPNIEGIGKLFLDMSDEFKVYGNFAKQFKYTIDLLDRLDTNPNERPKLYQYFCEKAAQHAIGFKGLLSKPLNQMASYELGLRRLSELTAPEVEDFKCTMNALAVIIECNKYMNTCILQSENTARIKIIEQKMVLNKKDPMVDKVYLECISNAQFIEDYGIELFVRRGVKKKSSGQLFLFSNMVGIAILSKGNQYQLKRVFKIEEVKIDVIEGGVSISSSTAPNPALSGGGGGGGGLGNKSPIGDTSIKIRFDVAKNFNDFNDRVKHLRERTDKNKVFGISLPVLLENEENNTGVPIIIQDLCEYMIETSLETVGIFRVPGSAQVERQMVNEYNSKGSKNVDIRSFNLSPNDAAGLFKLFFRELPTSLCGNLFTILVAINKEYEQHNNDEQLKGDLSRAVKTLLDAHSLRLFDFICKFMLKVAAKKDINKMDCSNVAMCIGPDILSPSVDSLELILLVPNVNKILGKIVEYSYEIF